MDFDRPKHADHIEDADEKRRRKWAEFIARKPDAFYAALNGISEAKQRAEQNQAVERDFAPRELTAEDHARLEKIEADMPKDAQKPDIAREEGRDSPEKADPAVEKQEEKGRGKAAGKKILPPSQRSPEEQKAWKERRTKRQEQRKIRNSEKDHER